VFNVVVRTTVRGPRWLTGGTYGIEASATGAAVVLLGLIAIWKWPVTPLPTATLPRHEEPVHHESLPGIQS
jgi:hypothetical protein